MASLAGESFGLAASGRLRSPYSESVGVPRGAWTSGDGHCRSLNSTEKRIEQGAVKDTAPPLVVDRFFPYKVGAVYAAILCDVVVSTYTDPMYNPNFALHILAFCLQLLNLLATALSFYLLLSDTFLVRKALYSRLFEEFRPVLLASLLYFLLFLLARLYRLGLDFIHVPHLQIWHRPGFFPIYILERLGGLFYYALLLRAVHRLVAEPRMHTHECVSA